MADPAIHPRRPTWRARLLLLAFGVVVSFVILEAGLRIVEAWRIPGQDEGWPPQLLKRGVYWAVYDPELGYRQNPEFGDMNALGFRDRPIGPKDDRFRVLMLGDSIAVYGDSVDDTFVGHLRGFLQSTPARDRVEVIDAGVKGYTNYQEVLLLKKTGVGLNPDLVGFEFCVNDLFKFLQTFEIENGQVVPGSYTFSTEALIRTPDSPLIALAKKSRLILWLKDHLRVAGSAAKWVASGGYSFDYRVDVRNAWQDQGWPQIERQLAQAVALGRERHFPVFVVAFPLGSQYDPGYLARDRDYVLKPQRKLREICDRLGIPFYDLYKDLGPADFKPGDDIHLSAQGRRAAGVAIAKFLTTSGLLPN